MNLESLLQDKGTLVDALSKVTYSLAVGACFDYYFGLRGWGIVLSRATATGINALTGHPYQRWREGWYQLTRTKEEDNSFRKWTVELGAINTFETYVYGIALSVGSLVSTGTIDFENVREGMIAVMVTSPLIGPTMGWYMDWVRERCGLKKASQKT